MDFHSHSLETLGVNKDADKSLNPEFKDPPSSQIPDMEKFTVPPTLHGNDAHGKEEASNYSIGSGASALPTATFSFPPLPSDLNTTPSDINFQAYDSVLVEQNSQDDGAHQVGDQEEPFDDMVILEDGMVTSASLSGGGGSGALDTYKDQDIQMEGFQQADIFNAASVASDVPNDTNVGDNAFEDQEIQMEDLQQADIFNAASVASDVPNNMNVGDNPEVPSVTVVTETIITSDVVVQEVTTTDLTTEDSLPPSHETWVTAVTPSKDEAVDAGKEVDVEQELPSDGAEAKMSEVVDDAEVVNPANQGEEPVQRSGPVAGSQEVSEEDVKAIKGQKVVKKFGRKNYSGEVTDFDPETKWFKVVYEDGDDEDLELWEVKLILESALGSPSSSKKRSRKESGADGSSKKSLKKPRKSGTNTTAKKTKSASKSSAKSPKTPGSKAKGSRGAKNSSVSLKGRSPGKLIKKALELSASKTPVDSQVKVGKGKVKAGTSTPRRNKGGSSKKRKTVKLSRSLNLQSPQGKEQAEPQSSGSKRATISPKQSASGPKRKAVGGATTAEKSKRAKKGLSVAEGDVSSLLGRHVTKDFNGVLYSGVVVKHDQKTGYFKVKYEDGDFEDLERVELEGILVQEAESAEEREDKPAKLSSLSSLISSGKKSGTQRRK